MAIVRWNDPFASLGSGRSPLDDLFSGFWGTNVQGSRQGIPAMDVYTEDDKALVVDLQAPGFTKDDITLNVHDGVLEIKGERHEKTEDDKKNRNYMVRETHESFYRSIALPKVADTDNVAAHFDNGILKVTVPFKELPAPKQINIAAGKPATNNKDKKK